MKMDEYPNPDEEYEMLHIDEMEAMVEMEKEMLMAYQSTKPRRSKNSLNFDNVDMKECIDPVKKNAERTEAMNSVNCGEIDTSKKRSASATSLEDMTSDLEVDVQPSKKRKLNPVLNGSCFVEDCSEYGITSFRVPKWPFIKISTSNGDKLYVKINENEPLEDMSLKFRNKSTSSSLLETPYSALRTLIEESFKEKLMREKEEDDHIDIEMSDKADLWVEQYKPRTYFDLLSDEAVNRTLLNWLKMWDKVVFKKELKDRMVSNQNNHNSENEQRTNLIKTLDSDGRPYYKIALLCGPPGLGKTTLAHIAARMAGYNAIEVNASDDRSIESLSLKLDNSTQMQPVMGKCRPTCLILDEIDGAPTATVDYLLKYVNNKCSEKGKKGKKENVKIVKRPIICICNELYTPSLRQLRQQAFVVHFPNTSATKLTQRLMEICKKQNIKTDVSALTMLCDKAQNDIRSCISTLHFFKNKNGQRFKSSDVLKSMVGLKDIQKSVFSIWKEIFHNPIKRTGVFQKALNKAVEDEVSSHVNYSKKGMDKLQNVVQICQAAGDYERLMEGIYENYLKSKSSGGAEAIQTGLEWFCWYDQVDTVIKKRQNYSLMPYLPYSFAMWQSLFSSNGFWKISYPSAGYENRMKESKCDQILSDVARGLNPSLRACNQKKSLLFDSLPLMDIILKPPLRPVNPTLFNEGEKKDFKHLIDVMVDFNFNYIQQRAVDGTYSYQLDPNIEELIKFNVGTQTNSRSYSYNLRQIIAHALDLEKMRRSTKGEESEKLPEKTSKEGKTSETQSQTQTYKPATLQPKEIKVKETGQYKDFFGRVTTRKESTGTSKKMDDKNNLVRSPIWFCFKEGYNNAVKKDITINDLL